MMAIAKVHIDIFKDLELYEMFYNYFSKVSIIKRDRDVLTFRVEGEGVPDNDNKQISLEIYKFNGIKPFVIGVDIYEYTR